MAPAVLGGLACDEATNTSELWSKPVERRRITLAREPCHLVNLELSPDGVALRPSRYVRIGAQIVVHWQLVEYDRELVGKPVIKGTRISVELVMDLLAAGFQQPPNQLTYLPL